MRDNSSLSSFRDSVLSRPRRDARGARSARGGKGSQGSRGDQDDSDAIFTTRFSLGENLGENSLSCAIKGSIDIAGIVTSLGSRAMAQAPEAAENAEIVQRIIKAGCRIIGHSTMHELAYGVTGINAWTGTPSNSKYPALIPGGSSSGSAVAVASGAVDFAIGTDTGGSIRVPAACCGIIGLKPSFGRVSRKGVVPVNSSLDCVGPFARDVDMIEGVMAILVPDWETVPPAPPASAASAAASAAKGKLAFVGTRSDESIAAAVRVAAEAAFEVNEVDLPDFEAAIDAGLKIIARETWDAFGPLTETGLVGRDVHDRLMMARTVTDDQLAEAEAVRARFTAQVDEILAGVDGLVLPTMPCCVPTLSEAVDSRAAIPITRTCRPFNLSGHPAISLPIAPPIGVIGGSPVAMQLVGQMNGDEALCGLARCVDI